MTWGQNFILRVQTLNEKFKENLKHFISPFLFFFFFNFILFLNFT